MNDNEPILCECGQPASDEEIAIARQFPKLFPASYKPLCDACREIAAERDRQERTKQDLEREIVARQSRLETIPPEMLRTSMGHPNFNAGLWLQIEQWEPTGRWLGIVGGAGIGKTRCLALLAKRLILAGHRLTWTTAVEFQDFCDVLNRGTQTEIQEAHQYFRRCKTTAILVLDDFGKNTWNPTTEKNLFALVDHRKTHDLPMLWTANTSPEDILRTHGLSQDRGAPLIGRLREASKIYRKSA
jgi:hypothetical protein